MKNMSRLGIFLTFLLILSQVGLAYGSNTVVLKKSWTIKGEGISVGETVVNEAGFRYNLKVSEKNGRYGVKGTIQVKGKLGEEDPKEPYRIEFKDLKVLTGYKKNPVRKHSVVEGVDTITTIEEGVKIDAKENFLDRKEGFSVNVLATIIQYSGERILLKNVPIVIDYSVETKELSVFVGPYTKEEGTPFLVL